MFFDSHCHLTSTALRDDFAGVIARANAAQVTYFLNIGDTIEASRAALQQAQEASAQGTHIWATAGIHPQNALAFDEAVTPDELRALAADPLIKAIGEIGLDYVYDETHEKYPGATRLRQREVFAAQLQLALELDLPVVVHNRESDDDIVDVIRAHPGVRGVLHCFSASMDTARRILDAGFYLGFTGLVTFKNAAMIREAANYCPIDRLLIETDAPYLAPVPYRGKTNEPAYVALVGQALAAERGLEVEEFARITTENACRLFACE
jgi:TatD DNase family protein